MKKEDITAWFNIENDGSIDSNYFHIRLKQHAPNQWKSIETPLKKYIENAHADARKNFFEGVGMNLDPLEKYEVDYPRHLPIETQKGFFGEVFCGILSETLDLVGRKTWTIPAFLFRFHVVATEYLTAMILNMERPNKIPGRTGSDFIALMLDPQGNIQEFLVGEAKCHQTLNITIAHDSLSKLGREPETPISLPQLKQILASTNKEKYAQTIASMEGLFLKKNINSIPRTDLFLYIFGDPKTKNYNTPRIGAVKKKQYHKNARPLQVAEVHIADLEALVSQIYSNIYLPIEEAASVND